MGKASQRKGADGERELVSVLNGYGYRVERGGSETFGTVPDITGLPGVHVEVKRTEKLNIQEAMEQAVRDSERCDDGVPTVFHRKNRRGWLVTMQLDNWIRLYRKEV